MAFDFWKKKQENVWSPLKEAPLGYWEEKSYMAAIPERMPVDVLSNAKERLSMIPGVILSAFSPDAATKEMRFTVFYEDEEYSGGIFVTEAQVPPAPGNLFDEEEWSHLKNAQHQLTVYMGFGKKPYHAYHLHLKLLVALVPDLIAIYDESAERMVNGRWAKMAAASAATPGPNDLFMVSAVAGEDGSVWLHTHGLCRFGLTELEILDSDREHYNDHYHVVSTLAGMMLDSGETSREGGFYIGMLADRIPVLAVAVPWTKALSEYPDLKAGGLSDRKDSHNSRTAVIFLYKSPEDQANDVHSKVSVYDDIWDENPIFYFSTAETNRMSQVARERFDSAKKAFSEGNTVLLKIGLPVDNGDDGEREHIWFELKSLEDRGFIATLTQEPYNVSGIHEGDDRFLSVDDITDWLVFHEKLQRRIGPDSAYLLED